MKRVHQAFAGLFLGLVFLAVGGPDASAQPDGIAIAVVQQARIDDKTGVKTLMPEAPVFSGDEIITDEIGEAQIRFRDDTKIVIGPNSMMIIDAFIFDKNADTARDISINAVRGAFRFISGKSPKDAYSIKTPTATIGIRG